MADLTTRLCGLELTNPFILASGPLSHDGEALLRAHRAGAAAVVTKTICREAARNPVPHIAKLRAGLLNAEKWSGLPARAWIDREIPLAKDGGATVIASVGLGTAHVKAFARPVAAAGADALEICSYDAAEMVPMVREAVRRVQVPVFAKVSANWPDVTAVAAACLGEGASGITATDSVGPALRLDVERRAPILGSGVGWLSGGAIFPISLRVVAGVALATGAAIVGTGGVQRVDECVEMLMAGAHADLADWLAVRLDELGYERVQDAISAALPALARCEVDPILTPASPGDVNAASFAWDRELCTGCDLCVGVCPYRARTKPGQVDLDACRYCGLCSSSCPTGALVLRTASAGGEADAGGGSHGARDA
jgi:dihydroorotate dehydrogenase/NAD-dependent dihydropyrimidine dehydrogenase PreA subunit